MQLTSSQVGDVSFRKLSHQLTRSRVRSTSLFASEELITASLPWSVLGS